MSEKLKYVKASECMCCMCKTAPAVAFWPCMDPDIQSHPYCRACLNEVQLKLMIELSEPPRKKRS